MLITNARLRHREGLHQLHLENGRIARIVLQGPDAPTAAPAFGPEHLDAGGTTRLPPDHRLAHREAETAKAHRG